MQNEGRVIKNPTFEDWQANLVARSKLCNRADVFFVFTKLDQFKSTYSRDVCVNGILFVHKRWSMYQRYGKHIENDEEVKTAFNTFGFKELKRCDDNVYDALTGMKHVFMSKDATGYPKDEGKSCIDTLSFIPNGLTDPIMLDAGDSFMIGDNNQILWCHCPFEMKDRDNIFNGIQVKTILEGTCENQMMFNADGTPQRFWIKDNIEQKICGITISQTTNSKRKNEDSPAGDIEVYNRNEFDFYAKEGQKCCNEEIDNTTPIKYKCLEPGHIQLTFINKNGQKITVDVNEKGESVNEIEEKKQNAISELKKIKIEFEDKENSQGFTFDNILTYVSVTINNDKVDGLSIDKNKPAQFIISKTEGILGQIYRLDKQKFPLDHDNKHEIIYTKQANGKNYVNYYDKNGKQQILDWGEYKKQRSNEYKNKSDFVIRKAIEQGECKTHNGKMKFNKYTGELKFINNKSSGKGTKKITTFNIYNKTPNGKMKFNKYTGELKFINNKSSGKGTKKITTVNIYK